MTGIHDVSGTRAEPKTFLWLSAEHVAWEGFDAVMKNRPLSVPGLSYKAIAALTRPCRSIHPPSG
jgi:hypothetical protein